MSRMQSDPWAGFQEVGQVPTAPSRTPPLTTDPWAEFQPLSPNPEAEVRQSYMTELEQLEASGQRLSIGARTALLDQHRRRKGMKPLLPDPSELRPVHEEATDIASRQNEQSAIRDVLVAPGRAAAQAPASLVSLFDPQAGLELSRNIDAYYGRPQRRAAKTYGDVVGTAATAISTVPTGPLGMAAAFGGMGAGGTRQDIAERRERGEEISGGQEAIAAAGIGAVEAASGFVGGKLFQRLGNQLRNVPGLRQLVTKEGVSGVVNLMKRIAPTVVAEAGEEAATQFADNLIKQQVYAPEQKLGEGVVEAGVMGGGLAPLLGGIRARQASGKTVDASEPSERRAGPALNDQGAEQSVESPTTTSPETGRTVSQLRFTADEAVAKVAKDHPKHAELMRSLISDPGESFVQVNVPLASLDIQSIADEAKLPRSGLSGEKVAKYAEQEGETAPPIFAVKNPSGDDTLFVGDGRHRVLAAALREQRTGTPQQVSALIPESEAVRLELGTKEPGFVAEKSAIPVRDMGDDPEVLADFAFRRAQKEIESLPQFKDYENAGWNPALAANHPHVAALIDARNVHVAQALESEAKRPKMVGGRNQYNRDVRIQAEEYTQKAGLRQPPQDYAPVNKDRAKRIAEAYEAGQHDPNDPDTKAAYDAFKKETKDQWDFLTSKGVKFEPWSKEGQPYKNSTEMVEDVRKNKHLYFFRGGEIPADHPLAEKAGVDDLTYNDVFRAVHDYFGHAKEGYQFGPRGEENAWRTHSVMYGPEARRAMTTETRGQNSWVNFGPKGVENQADPSKTTYAEQKAFLLPDEFVSDGVSSPPPPTEPPAPPTPEGDEPAPRRGRYYAESPEDSQSRLGKLWSRAIDVFRDPTKGPLADLEKRIIQSKGATSLASMDADKLGVEYTKLAKEANLDPESEDVQRGVEAVLRNKAASPAMKTWAENARKSLDAESENLAAKLESVGLKKQAEAVRQNVGSYLKNVPIETVSPTGRMKDWARRKLALSPSFGKVKRDKWIAWDGEKFLQKFDTQEQAQAFLDGKIKARKESLIKKGAKERGVSEADLNRRAARGLKLTEPISEEWRSEHEVHDPRYLVARSIVETRHNAEMVGLFQWAAETYGEEAPADLTAEEIQDWADASDLKLLPEGGRLHDLKGTYVPEEVADRLSEHVRLPGEVERFYRAALAAWKSSKTVYNPGTHVRNVLTNALIFADLADTSPLNPTNWGSYSKAVDSMLNKASDPVVRAAISKGLIGNEYSSTELRMIQEAFKAHRGNVLEAMFSLAGKINKNVKNFYDAQDQIFKIATVHNNMRKGVSMDEAIAVADEWFPNYARTAKITRWLRNTPLGAPFVSFFDQSLRIAGRAVKRKPLKVAKIVAIPYLLDTLSRAMLGLRDEEEKLLAGQDSQIKRWMQPLTSPIIPKRDAQGRVMTVDLASILPLANDLIPHERNGSLRIPWLLSGPFSTAVIEQMSGQESFTGRPFLQEKMTTGQNLQARAGRFFDTMAPLPTIATYGRSRIAEATEGTSEENTGRAVLGALGGVNIRTPYIQEKVVRKIAQNMVGEKDRDAARSLIREWNETYKRGDLKEMDFKDVVRGGRTSMKRSRQVTLDEAARSMIQGDEDAASEIVKEYNVDRPSRLTELTLKDVAQKAKQLRREGVRY